MWIWAGLILLTGLFIVTVFWFMLRPTVDLEPPRRFLEELAEGRSVGHDKRLMAMLHSSVLEVAERGLIRALGRHISSQYGRFVGFVPSAMTVQSKGHIHHFSGQCRFSNAVLKAEIGWMTSRRGTGWVIVAFDIAAPENKTMNIMEHVEPEQLSSFCEKFSLSLFSSNPEIARLALMPSLRSKYDSAEALARFINPAMKMLGGLHERGALDITLTSAKKVPFRGVTAALLSYHVKGKQHDLEMQLTVLSIGLQCSVASINMKTVTSESIIIV